MPPMLSLGTNARLSENGRPIVELMVRSSFAGMMSRMLCSTWATTFSVSSSREPVGARTCSLRMPTSEVGKKSVPITGASAPVATSSKREAAEHEFALLQRQFQDVAVGVADAIEAAVERGRHPLAEVSSACGCCDRDP